MKTSILTLAFALLALIGIDTARAATHGKEAVTILSQAVPVSKIEVRGNVELYLSGGTTDQIKVYNNYYSENAMVQGQDGVLRITSYGDQKLVVWVTSSSLQKLSVYDNATVQSFGMLSAIELDVHLYDNASARLNMDAYIINMKLHGRAKADLSGSAFETNLNCDCSSTLNYAALNSEHLNKTVNYEAKSFIALQ